MSVPTYLDAAAIGIPAILGVLGAWLGFRRALVSWPIRWLVPFFGASAAATLAVLYLVVYGETAALLNLSGMVGKTAVSAAVFLVTLLMLVMFMSNLRERVIVWTGQRRIGSAERVFGGLLGVACGLLLVAFPYGLYETLRSEPDNDPAWLRESFSLPYFRSAGEAVKSALSHLPTPAGQSLPQR